MLLLLALASPLPWSALLVSPPSPTLDGDLDEEEGGNGDEWQASSPGVTV